VPRERGAATHSADRPQESRRTLVACVVVSALIVLPHLVASPGYTTVPWGDYGRWLHEVERFASGEVLYRDFTWPFPPLAIWIAGGWAKLFGAGLASINTFMALVTITMVAVYIRLVVRKMPGELAPWVLATSLLLSLALVQRESASLPLGTYSPALPIGGLLLLVAITLTISDERSASRWRNVALGACCGAMVLTKQGFWLPAGLLVLVSHSWVVWVAFGGVVVSGILLVVVTAGADVLPGVVSGFNHVQELGMYSLPSWEGMTVTLIATAFFGAALVLTAGGPLRLTALLVLVGAELALLHLYMTFRLVSGATISSALIELANRGSTQVPPVLMPAAAIAWLVWNRRRIPGADWLLAAFFLCLAARVRRGFSFTGWYHVLLEIPLYVLLVMAMNPGKDTQRRLRLALAGLLVFAVAAEWTLGRVPLVGIGTLPKTQTLRGMVHWRPDEAARMRWLQSELDRRDPARTRPLLAFGYSGGYSYFLDRPPATGATQGFRLSRFDPDSVIRELARRKPPIFALDSRDWDGIQARAPAVPLTSWFWPMRDNHYVRIERPYFDRIRRNCLAVSRFPEHQPELTLYDCRR
jgi:hypothetical protein